MPTLSQQAAPNQSAPSALAPYDALLVVSFGGPEGPDDVVPFLRNVTRGRNIPEERLVDVGEHYYRFGGVSPINAQNRALVGALEAELRGRRLELPVYWGNRNWDPYLADTCREMLGAGVRRAAVFVTAAYSSYSGCRQYREDLASAFEDAGAQLIEIDKLRHYFNHPGFIQPTVDAVTAALSGLPETVRSGAHLAYVTHSIPTAMADSSGPPHLDTASSDTPGGAYVRQHREVARLVSEGVAAVTGVAHPWELVFCSRSGSPAQPWLEPDINDHLGALAAAGAPGVVMVPIGFVSDHMEVKFDLDTEGLETAHLLGLPAQRAATAGVDPRFVAMVVDLLSERARVEQQRVAETQVDQTHDQAQVDQEQVPLGDPPSRPCVGLLGPSHDICPTGCCPNLRAPRPALAGADAAAPAASSGLR